MKKVKNIAASVRAKLLVIARKSNRDFNAIMLQYFQERFLYRLSLSPSREHFVLKGALLFQIYRMPASRPTTDIDFWGMNIKNSKENIVGLVKEILMINCEDGVNFDVSSITFESIKDTDDYLGLRLFFVAYLGKAKRRIHLDIGFGDIIIPQPANLEFPVILENQAAPKIIAYTPESAIAEKFEAIVSLGFYTSRMKDFYDIYYMSKNYTFTSDKLKKAINTTFNNRSTNLEEQELIFSKEFVTDINKSRQWSAFIVRLGIITDLTFEDCVNYIEKLITPILKDNMSVLKWNTEIAEWEKFSLSPAHL